MYLIKKIKILSYIILVLHFISIDVFAYDNDYVHPIINSKAVILSNKFLEALNILGFEQGIDNLLIGIEIYKWFEVGSTKEDEPQDRTFNHFHDPNRTWDEAGLKSSWIGCSSILWAQNKCNNPNDKWSWSNAREYYYRALTAAEKTVREQNLADTFQTMGQQMHLLSDAAVPEHVRNDIHIFPWFAQEDKTFRQIGRWTYETWCRFNSDKLPTTKVPAVISITNNYLSPELVPISNFWDTTPSAGYSLNPVGLAEYTNFNFLSSDTVFKNYEHPNPLNSAVEIDPVVAEDGKVDYRVYFKGITSDGQPINHLASTGYLWYDLTEISTDNINESKFNLDDSCFKDYAAILIPKAIGYSAALLDYFFRGQINLEPAANFQYLIRNNSAEDMSGDFSLYYDEKNTGSRKLIINWQALTIPAYGASTPVSFAAPADAQTPGVYMLVFKGTMGAEKDAVAGRLIKPGWQEEWDSSLKGNHSWLFTGIDLPGQNPSTGSTVNSTADGKLVKENIRYAGNSQPRVNSTFIGDAFLNPLATLDKYCADSYLTNCFADDFGLEFPLPITRNTRVRVKVDEMSINVAIPDQNCGSTFGPGGYQGITMTLDNGTRFSFTVPGQQPFGISLNAYLEPGQEKEFNIFNMLTNAGVQFTEPINLVSINLSQQLWYLCSPSTEEHRQRMVVDYIRIEE